MMNPDALFGKKDSEVAEAKEFFADDANTTFSFQLNEDEANEILSAVDGKDNVNPLWVSALHQLSHRTDLPEPIRRLASDLGYFRRMQKIANGALAEEGKAS